MPGYWVYVLTNKPRGTLYVGVTNDLVRRAHEHREGLIGGFAKRISLKCWFTLNGTMLHGWLFSVKRTSSTGQGYGKCSSLKQPIRSGVICMATLPVDGHDNSTRSLPGIAVRRTACFRTACHKLSVMRGLDPRIHDERHHERQYCLPGGAASWIAGSSPAMTVLNCRVIELELLKSPFGTHGGMNVGSLQCVGLYWRLRS